jgi:predicted pyridoxine 5'-phosphate oxidase superfamily flavin-nucleotide-binding protein
MTRAFLDISVTPSVRTMQVANGARPYTAASRPVSGVDQLGESEQRFIEDRDSFYLATVSETGWPYVQHRGGPKGFLHLLDGRTLAFADFRGNRQYISTGNLTASDRAAIILVDYANRRRLKLYARVEMRSTAESPELTARVAPRDYRGVPEHITPRFDEAQVLRIMEPVRARIAQLEAENAALRALNPGAGDRRDSPRVETPGT